MAQIEDAADDVRIDGLFSVDIEDIGAFPVSDDKVDPDIEQRIWFMAEYYK
jgi:hypothetical protein